MAYDLQRIQAQADAELSHFDGYADDGSQGFEDGDGYEGDEYTGFNDDNLEHGFEGSSFGTEMARANQYTFSVENTSSTQQDVIINPSLNPSDTLRVIRDGAIPFAGHSNNLIATAATDKKINYFLEHCKYNPTRVVGFGFDTDKREFFNGVIRIERRSPYKTLGSDEIQMQNHIDPKNFLNNLMRVPVNDVQFDDQTQVTITLPANSKVSITCYMGTSVNMARSLSKKAKRASRSTKVIAQKAALAGR